MITWRAVGGGSGALPESIEEEDALRSTARGLQWLREKEWPESGRFDVVPPGDA